jgi:hypothetical protein
MGLIERLEKRARELDEKVRRFDKEYNKQAADDRDLLLEAVESLRLLRLKISVSRSKPMVLPDD